MKIVASVKNTFQKHEITVSTADNEKRMTIDPKADGFGSSINGGELLFLSLATCFCNDLYREAGKRHMKIDSVEVLVSGEFGAEGEPAKSIGYEVRVAAAGHCEKEISELIKKVDEVAEIHNTLRKGIQINLKA